MNLDKELYTTREVADMIGLGDRAVIRMCDNGMLQCLQRSVGQRRYITRSSLQEMFLRQQRIDPHISIAGTTGELVNDVRLMLLELRRRPDFNPESIRDVIPE